MAKKKVKNNSFESKPMNKFFIVLGCLLGLGFGFLEIADGKAYISLLISLFITWFCFKISTQDEKKVLWIIIGVISIIADVLYAVATLQLFIK